MSESRFARARLHISFYKQNIWTWTERIRLKKRAPNTRTVFRSGNSSTNWNVDEKAAIEEGARNVEAAFKLCKSKFVTYQTTNRHYHIVLYAAENLVRKQILEIERNARNVLKKIVGPKVVIGRGFTSQFSKRFQSAAERQHMRYCQTKEREPRAWRNKFSSFQKKGSQSIQSISGLQGGEYYNKRCLGRREFQHENHRPKGSSSRKT